MIFEGQLEEKMFSFEELAGHKLRRRFWCQQSVHHGAMRAPLLSVRHGEHPKTARNEIVADRCGNFG